VRLVRYIRATKDMKLLLAASEDRKIDLSVDTSYAVHKDIKNTQVYDIRCRIGIQYVLEAKVGSPQFHRK
jgi:hypothetical protein